MAMDLSKLLADLRQERQTLLEAIAALERLAGAKRPVGRPPGHHKDRKDEAVFPFKTISSPQEGGPRRK
jgi:hypothetical protein